MGLEQRLQLKLGQQLVMTPQLQQAIKLLQLSRNELEQEIESELEKNPALELGADESQPEPGDVKEGEGSLQADITESHQQEQAPEKDVAAEVGTDTPREGDLDWEKYLESYQTLGYQAPSGEVDRGAGEDMPGYEATLTRKRTLQDHLHAQLAESDLSGEEFEVAEVLLGSLDDDGYLRLEGFPLLSQLQRMDLSPSDRRLIQALLSNLDEAGFLRIPEVAGDPLLALAETNHVSPEAAERLLAQVQTLEPRGMGSRSLVEFLALQARALPPEETGLPGERLSLLVRVLEEQTVQWLAGQVGPWWARGLRFHSADVSDSGKSFQESDDQPEDRAARAAAGPSEKERLDNLENRLTAVLKRHVRQVGEASSPRLLAQLLLASVTSFDLRGHFERLCREFIRVRVVRLWPEVEVEIDSLVTALERESRSETLAREATRQALTRWSPTVLIGGQREALIDDVVRLVKFRFVSEDRPELGPRTARGTSSRARREEERPNPRSSVEHLLKEWNRRADYLKPPHALWLEEHWMPRTGGGQVDEFATAEVGRGLQALQGMAVRPSAGVTDRGNTFHVAQVCGVTPECVERVVRRIQQFEPAGVGARELSECLLIQARMLGKDAQPVGTIVTRLMKELEGNNIPAIARKLGVELAEAARLVKLVGMLEPKPGRNYASGTVADEPQYISADIAVVRMGNEWVTVLNEDGMPRLRVSRAIQTLLKRAKEQGLSGAEQKRYIERNLESARWFVKSVLQRQRTIRKVTESIVKFQRDFFDKGVRHLRPLILKDVADDIEMHESTISRVTSSKYVQTPHGIFELKYFFNSSIQKTGGDALASEAVKDHIQKLIAEEDPKKPFSDQEIVVLLQQRHGIEIARRTVAKYRDVLEILPSSKRKQYV